MKTNTAFVALMYDEWGRLIGVSGVYSAQENAEADLKRRYSDLTYDPDYKLPWNSGEGRVSFRIEKHTVDLN